MTHQLKFTDKEATQELEFPDTGASRVKHLGDANGHVINYIDNKGEPDSVFIDGNKGNSWDWARAYFENTIPHDYIDSHYPAKISIDF